MNKIPQLKQTAISIKNRLRRYHSGSLKYIFSFDNKADKLSNLLKKNCIIDLGNILKLGGSKEDVIFFANLVLKWIWENNMKKEATQELKHLTIFEDASYIASKNILKESKLSSYLEDIALLLRGKGEALISITTTLDISKNIILNSGSKFFFKFQEKLDDVLYFLGIQDYHQININELKIGYCITKIDSISNPFLLKSVYLKEKRKKQVKKLKRINIKKEKEKNISHSIMKKSYKPLNLNKIRILINLAEELYLIEDFIECFTTCQEIFNKLLKYYSNHYHFPKFENLYDLYQYLCNNLQKNRTDLIENTKQMIIISKNFKKGEKIQHDEILILLERIKNTYNSIINLFTKEQIKLSDKLHFNNKLIKVKNNSNSKIKINLRVYQIKNLSNPVLYFNLSSEKIEKVIEKKIFKFLKSEFMELDLFFKNYYYYLNKFEIDSLWSKSMKEKICILLFFKMQSFPDESHLNLIKRKIYEFIKFQINKKKLFYAFYLRNNLKKVKFKSLILKESKSLKKESKSLFEEVEGIFLKGNIKKIQNIKKRSSYFQIEENVRKILESENLMINK